MHRLFTPIAALAALAACAQEEQTSAPAIELYAMECGRMAFQDAAMFASDGGYDGVARDLVNPCYLIRHPDGDLIWDLGFPDAIADMPDGLHVAEMGDVHITMPAKLEDQLAQLDLTPADIEYIAVSHGHVDHTGNGALMAGSTWIVDPDERGYMFREEARAAPEFANYAPLENAEARSIEGDGDYDVFGDGSVTIIQAPGHTPGHSVLLVRLANAGPVLLTGDMYHLAESRERRAVPVFNTDPEQTLASMDKIEAIASETGALVIRQHVAEDLAALPAFPAALN